MLRIVAQLQRSAKLTRLVDATPSRFSLFVKKGV